MFHSTTLLRSTSGLAALPFALLAVAACSGSDDDADVDGSGAASAAGNSATGGEADGAGNTSSGGATSADAGESGFAGAGLGPAPVQLGAASKYAILAKSAIVNDPTSVVTGDLGLSPAAATYMTGFSPTRAGTHWTSAQVVGSLFAANNDAPTPINLTTAVGNMQTAYTDAAGRPSPDFLNLEAGTIGGLTLEPGLYKWTSTVTIPTDVTLEGGSRDVWIFQVTGDLKLSATKQMILSGGARPKNIFWQVSGMVDFGATSHAEGIVLSKTAITLKTGSSINGRLLAQTAVNISGATVTAP